LKELAFLTEQGEKVEDGDKNNFKSKKRIDKTSK
jgi:hypothetical protein